ncbi:MAG: virginiamycin lyase [Pyrinomonadaceae bacterium]|jgi:sugar lactone lactonase YvrE|nr:virginiamycin lyase [Pyrinomonadaceae bacterium]
MKHKFLIVMLVLFTPLFLFSAAAAHPATGIVLDRAGNVYFSDLETVWKIDKQGRLSVFRAGVSGRHVHELTIDAQDNIYGGDISYEGQKWVSDVWKMRPDGTSTYLLEPTTHPPRSMSNWLDRDGNMYLVDQNNHTKMRTVLLRRSPDGQVISLAGGAYGHQDGKGAAAKFSSVGGMAFGPDGSLYLSDGAAVRKVTMEGSVTTLARELTTRTVDDKPSLFGTAYGSLTGLAVSSSGSVYVADAGNRRLLRINPDRKTEVVLRTDPPYFPNGVAASPDGAIYVLEVGFTLPNISSGPRVRKISADGSNRIIATVGSQDAGSVKAAVAQGAGMSTEGFLSFFPGGNRIKYGAAILGVTLLSTVAILWRRRKLRA